MDDKISGIGVAQFNPYIRYVNRLEGSVHENHVVPWRILYDFEVIFVTQGELHVICEDREYTIGEGCLHIMPPYVRHTRVVPEQVVTSYYGVHLDFMFDEDNPDFSAWEVYKEPCERKLNAVPIRGDLAQRKGYRLELMEFAESCRVKNRFRFTELFEKLYAAFSENTVAGRLRAKAYMTLIIAALLEELGDSGENPETSDFVSRFIEYMTHHYSEAIDLNKVVSEYGISPSRFRVLFKKQMNRAPLEYIIDYRMEQAKKLFATGKYNISEVSYMVGYDDMHYFSRLFKQKVGCSPTEFIKKQQGSPL